MTQEELMKLQAEFDVKKWYDSQANGNVDTCGSYAFCVKCDKNVEYPCAKAQVAFEVPAFEAPVSEKPKAKKSVSDKVVRMRKPRTKKE